MSAVRTVYVALVSAAVAATNIPALADPAIPALALAEPEIQFPIVFTDNSKLEDLGVSLEWPPPQEGDAPKAPRFPNGCYLYRGQDRDLLISVSDEFLNRYKAKGFSRESLCLALVSEARFDPETGSRLPTYVLRNDAVLQKWLEGLDPGKMTTEELTNFVPGLFTSKAAFQKAINRGKKRDFSGLDMDQASALVPAEHHTYELPLKVPDCFRNGTPYLDCNWKYGLKSGKKLSEQAPKRYREVGELFDQQIKAHIAAGKGSSPYEPDDPYFKDSVNNGAYLLIDGLVGETEPGVNWVAPSVLIFEVPDHMIGWAESIAWFAKSSSFPRGYGYALYAWSAFAEKGGPAVSQVTLRAAFDGEKRSSKISKASLKKILD